jgi:hypothetical protein
MTSRSVEAIAYRHFDGSQSPRRAPNLRLHFETRVAARARTSPFVLPLVKELAAVPKGATEWRPRASSTDTGIKKHTLSCTFTKRGRRESNPRLPAQKADVPPPHDTRLSRDRTPSSSR